MALSPQQQEVIRRCRKSAIWFMSNFIKIKHPGAGIIPFNPFDYQQNAIRTFRKERMVIFRKTRQCFAGQSPVSCPSGPRRIDSIKPGDSVCSFDAVAHCPVIATVQEVYENPPAQLLSVQADGHNSLTTAEHVFFTERGEVPAGRLVTGDNLIGISAGGWAVRRPVRAVIPVGMSPGPLYDLRVPPHDNYVVDGAVVHNCGISKVSGIFALWFGMFSPHKTILIVSRRDEDAMNFLSENVKLPFKNLPAWMQSTWLPKGYKDNDHSMSFANGSIIRSLTSHPDVLRSNASSLNIIDEAAFINGMDAMWAAGRPTLSHGGSVIVISTTNGVGNWYWNTWTDAEAGANDFTPLMINWWDMHWRIEYVNPLSGERTMIAPTDGIVPTAKGTYAAYRTGDRVELLPEKYGPFWSPWLEDQYRDLQSKGESWKFDQEILAAFVGSGNTVLPKSVLVHVGKTVNDNYKVVTGSQTYVHPVTSDVSEIDFTPKETDEGLWVWRQPILATPDKVLNGQIIEPGRKAHSYVAGVDIATGKGRDYHALEMYDVDAMEQVAEAMFHCLPSIWKKMIDLICRMYNCALAVVERNNGGDLIIDDLASDFMYPRLWRRSTFDGRTTNHGPYGFFTSSSSKPAMNKFLLDNVRDKDGEGFRIYSRRLSRQLSIYVRKRDKAGRDTGKTEAESGSGNFDDLVMATGLALVGVPDSYQASHVGSTPYTASQLSMVSPLESSIERQKKIAERGNIMIPMAFGSGGDIDASMQEELIRFMSQIGGLPTALGQGEKVHKKKHQF